MYDYTYYDYGYEAASAATGLAAFGAGLLVFWLIAMAVSVVTIISMWKVFKKAGKPGWAAIIPIYNTIVMIEIAELPMWYIALYFVPGANIYAMIKINIEIAHKFGKSTGFGVGMALLAPVFLTMLAFSKNSNFVGVQNVTQPAYQPQQPVQPMVAPVQEPVVPVQPMVTPIQEPVAPVQPMVTPIQEPVAPVQPMVAPVQEPVAPVQPTVAPVQEPVTPPQSNSESPINQNTTL